MTLVDAKAISGKFLDERSIFRVFLFLIARMRFDVAFMAKNYDLAESVMPMLVFPAVLGYS